MKTSSPLSPNGLYSHSKKNPLTQNAPIQKLSLDMYQLFISYLPDEMHPFAGYSLGISSSVFWNDFLAVKQQTHSRETYFSAPLARKVKWILKHREGKNLILALAHSYEKNPLFLSIIEQLMEKKENPFGFISCEKDFSSFFSINDCLLQYATEFKEQTRNLPIKKHLFDLFQENVLTFDDIPTLTRSDVLACLSNTHIQSLLADEIIAIDDLKEKSWWKLTLGTQIPFYRHFLRNGHLPLSELESKVSSATAFLFKFSILIILIFLFKNKNEL